MSADRKKSPANASLRAHRHRGAEQDQSRQQHEAELAHVSILPQSEAESAISMPGMLATIYIIANTLLARAARERGFDCPADLPA
jgi:hypothetical protein